MTNRLQTIETRLHYIEQQQQEDKDQKKLLIDMVEKLGRLEENIDHIIQLQMEQGKKADHNSETLKSYGVTIDDAREFMREHLKDHRQSERRDLRGK